MIAYMATPGGRTCYRPNSRSSTTADRAPDDCAAHRAASRRALREHIREGNCRGQRQEKEQRYNPKCLSEEFLNHMNHL